MSTCTRWVDDGTIACTDWAEQTRKSCEQWADEGSNQCQTWADEGSNRCSSWADDGYNECCTWAPCSWFCDALVWISNWVCQAWYWVSNWVCQAWYWVAKWVCVAVTVIVQMTCVVWSWVADWICISWDNLRCGLFSLFGGNTVPSGPIKHVFVLMLENRAFDHMLGFAGITGTEAGTGRPTQVDGLTQGGPFSNPDPHGTPVDAPVAPSTPADFSFANLAQDPGHEFNNALLQLCGYQRDASGNVVLPSYPANGPYPPINNQGFIGSYFGLFPVSVNKPNTTDPERVMKCFTREQLPVLTTLAETFVVCDRWFSSLPGPTWPNRFFLHAASSGGLDDSPSNLEVAVSSFLNGFRFENGTIFDRLEDACFDWKVFMGDEFPQVFAISGMTDQRLQGHFKGFDQFAAAVSDPDFSTPYVFIEPDYGNVLPLTPGDFTCGTSQHPLDDVTRGERLIKQVYEAIRNSPHWNESLLLVTYDEQGGFYDHVAPPPCVSPGDVIADENNNHHNFNFEQLGIRVPAVVISPLIPANRIDHTIYDHTSLLATVERLFGLKPLTNRDAQANSFDHLLSLSTPLGGTPTVLPEPPDSGFHCHLSLITEVSADDRSAIAPADRAAVDVTTDTSADEALSGIELAFLHVAFLRDYHRTSLLGKPAAIRRFQAIKTRGQAKVYVEQVRRRMPKVRRTVVR